MTHKSLCPSATSNCGSLRSWIGFPVIQECCGLRPQQTVAASGGKIPYALKGIVTKDKSNISFRKGGGWGVGKFRGNFFIKKRREKHCCQYTEKVIPLISKKVGKNTCLEILPTRNVPRDHYCIEYVFIYYIIKQKLSKLQSTLGIH